MKDTIEKSALEKYTEDRLEDAKQNARYHSTPRLDAFRGRLDRLPTSKLVEYISDYRARLSVLNAVGGTLLFSALLCGEVLVPYRALGLGWTGPHVKGRPDPESYPDDHDTLYAGYVATCDELDRRLPEAPR